MRRQSGKMTCRAAAEGKDAMTVTGIKTGGIGQPVIRKEDLRLVAGNGRYTDDVSLPGQVHLVIVRSPHAHARIAGVDAAAALRIPGVIAVLTAKDVGLDKISAIPCYSAIPGLVDVPLKNRDGSPTLVTPLPLLAADKVRFVGDCVAAVVAETRAVALEGAETVDVSYEPLPAVTATVKAASSAAPQLWDMVPGNVCIDAGFGNEAAANEAFARAAHVARLETTINRVTGVMMEPRAAVCQFDAATGRFTMYCGGDNSVRLKRDLATVVGVPPENMRVVARDIGGNFGTRNWTYPEYAIVVWVARKFGRPARWTAVRSEAFISDYQGRDLHVEAELALDRDGRFLGLRASLTSNVGAHTVSFVPLNKTSELLSAVYHIPAAWVRSRAVLSNTASTAPYRSAGRPEAMFIMERLIDRAAREFGFDPVELRRRNVVPAGALPYKNPLGLTYDSGKFGDAMEKALELGDWKGHSARRAAARRRGKLCGIGLANYIEVTSGFPVERTEITVRTDRRVDVIIGTTPSGQGHETSFAQCVADWLGVPFESIRLITGDTDIVKEGGGSHSARSMRMAGIVMGKASEMIIEKGKQIAAYMMEAAASDIEFVRGRYSIKGTDRSVGIFDVAAAAETRGDLPDGLKGPLGAAHQELMKVPGFPYGAQVCEVEIDPDTGTLEIVRHAAVDDVGRAINPLILHGQAHGGIVMAAGQALCEHAYYDPSSGQMLAGSFMDYAMPRADMFPSFATEIMEVPTPTNPLGVRGGGEGGATPALAVIVNAVVDALRDYDVTHFDMPLTPERIWRAIHGSGRA
jgi:carbon-monoxide dehydrogenase large subunit